METIWKDSLADDPPPPETVEVFMTPNYNDPKYPNRPSSVTVEYSIAGRGKVKRNIDNPRPMEE